MDEPVILKIFLIGYEVLLNRSSQDFLHKFSPHRFHHKKGWVQEHCYPDEEIRDLDMEHLPTLCLPDQSHNFESDSVYFVLPNKNASDIQKVFGKA